MKCFRFGYRGDGEMDANIEGSLAAEVTMVVLDMLELIVQVHNLIKNLVPYGSCNVTKERKPVFNCSNIQVFSNNQFKFPKQRGCRRHAWKAA